MLLSRCTCQATTLLSFSKSACSRVINCTCGTYKQLVGVRKSRFLWLPNGVPGHRLLLSYVGFPCGAMRQRRWCGMIFLLALLIAASGILVGARSSGAAPAPNSAPPGCNWRIVRVKYCTGKVPRSCTVTSETRLECGKCTLPLPPPGYRPGKFQRIPRRLKD